VDSTYERQQERKRNEPPARSWETVRAAIEDAKGAREGVVQEDRFGGVGDER
jgi:hypothetical protein